MPKERLKRFNSTSRRRKLVKKIRKKKFAIRPCDRYIQSGFIYYINFNFNFYIKYIAVNCLLYLLLVTEADWACIAKKLKNSNKLSWLA